MCNNRCLEYACGHWDMISLSHCRGVTQIPDAITKAPVTACYGRNKPVIYIAMESDCRACVIDQALKGPRARLSEAIQNFRKCKTGAFVANVSKATRELEAAIAELQAIGLPEQLVGGSKRHGLWFEPHDKVQEGSPLRRELVVDSSFELRHA